MPPRVMDLLAGEASPGTIDLRPIVFVLDDGDSVPSRSVSRFYTSNKSAKTAFTLLPPPRHRGQRGRCRVLEGGITYEGFPSPGLGP